MGNQTVSKDSFEKTNHEKQSIYSSSEENIVQSDQKTTSDTVFNIQERLPITVASKNLFENSKSQQNMKRLTQQSRVERQHKENNEFHKDRSDEKLQSTMLKMKMSLGSKKRRKKTSINIDPEKFVVMKKNSILDDFLFENQIGSGSFGTSYVCLQRKTHQKKVVKMIEKDNLHQQEFDSIMNQFQILRKMDHPHIIKLYEVYNDSKYLYVVMQLCQGGDLLKVTNKLLLSEDQVRDIMIQVLSAVSYMHEKKIIHKDIKLENIVVVKKVNKTNFSKIKIKIIDFGLSIDMQKHKMTGDQHLSGTLLYSPPESISGIVNYSWDIWSCGILCYILATNKIPYRHHTSEDQLIKYIEKASISRKYLQGLSSDMKRFLSGLLQKDYQQRNKAEKALKDSWIQQGFQKDPISRDRRKKTIYQLQKKTVGNSLISLVESYLVSKRVSQEERQKYATIFEALDQDKNGLIEIQELRKFYNQNTSVKVPNGFENLLSTIDQNNSGKIDFNELLVCLVSRKKLFQYQYLLEAFSFLDKRCVSSLKREDIKIALQGVDQEQITKIFEEVDLDKDQQISEQQFVAYFETLAKQ